MIEVISPTPPAFTRHLNAINPSDEPLTASELDALTSYVPAFCDLHDVPVLCSDCEHYNGCGHLHDMVDELVDNRQWILHFILGTDIPDRGHITRL